MKVRPFRPWQGARREVDPLNQLLDPAHPTRPLHYFRSLEYFPIAPGLSSAYGQRTRTDGSLSALRSPLLAKRAFFAILDHYENISVMNNRTTILSTLLFLVLFVTSHRAVAECTSVTPDDSASHTCSDAASSPHQISGNPYADDAEDNAESSSGISGSANYNFGGVFFGTRQHRNGSSSHNLGGTIGATRSSGETAISTGDQ